MTTTATSLRTLAALVAWVDSTGVTAMSAFAGVDTRPLDNARNLINLAGGHAAIQAAPPAATVPLDDMEELRRALACIGVVGQIDGHDVVRRLSVLSVADDRIRRVEAAAA